MALKLDQRHGMDRPMLTEDMTRYENMGQREVTLLLLHIHDKLWNDKAAFSLRVRIDSCGVIQELLKEFHLNPIGGRR